MLWRKNFLWQLLIVVVVFCFILVIYDVKKGPVQEGNRFVDNVPVW